MLSTHDIHWAAGFLEGEGSFRARINRQRVRGNASPEVAVTQVQRQPLEKMQRLFGGNIYIGKRANRNHSPIHRLSWCGQRAAEIMMTMYSLMSPKRQTQISEALTVWRRTPRPGEFNRVKTACKHGHPFDEANTYRYRGTRKCLTCAKQYDAKRRQLKRDADKGAGPSRV